MPLLEASFQASLSICSYSGFPEHLAFPLAIVRYSTPKRVRNFQSDGYNFLGLLEPFLH